MAVITGGARGFGRAAAELFAEEGAKVVIGDLLDDLGPQVVGAIQARGGAATYQRTDVTSEDQVRALMQTAVSSYGHLDILLANAGILLPGKLEEFTETQYYQQMDVNVKGVWLACKHAIPAMRSSGGGSIVITASGAGLKGSKVSPLYGASKGACVLMGLSLALQVATENIRCNVVCPGPVATDLYRLGGVTPEQFAQNAKSIVPMGHVGEPEDIAQAMLFLASDAAKFITGATLAVDGGWLTA